MAENDQIVSPNYTNIYIPDMLLQTVNQRETLRSRSLGPQMPKVPQLLRQQDKNNQQEYDPLVVSLGPYHHGKEELQLTEDFKIKTLEMLVEDCGKDICFFHTKVLEVVNDARICYVDGSTSQYDDTNFAKMMLLDACFIINYVVVLTGTNLRNNRITADCLGDLRVSLIQRDLFLLENQIPFGILKMLIVLGYGNVFGEQLLDKFWNKNVSGKYKISDLASSYLEQPFHLLDAFWMILSSESSTYIMFKNAAYRPNKAINFSKKCINQLKTKFPFQWRKRGEYGEREYVQSFKSVSMLRSRGIHFRPSNVNSLKSIKFKPGYLFATLELPIWFVSKYTKGFFLNMIAHEACLSDRPYRFVTAYVMFMKALIDNPNDVEELREKQILLASLGNEDVVKVFKELHTYDLLSDTIFYDVKKEIQAHYYNKGKTWLGELVYIYFRTPWTAITCLAATILLLLTFLQTYFTINH